MYIGGKFGWDIRLGNCVIRYVNVDEIELFLEKVINYYKESGKKGERLGKIIDRLGIDSIKKVLDFEIN